MSALGLAASLLWGLPLFADGTVEVFGRLEGGGAAYLLRSRELTIAGAPRPDGKADLFAFQGKRVYRWYEGERRFAIQLVDRAFPWYASVETQGALVSEGTTMLDRPADRFRFATSSRLEEITVDRESGLLLKAVRPSGGEAFVAEQVLARAVPTRLRDYGFDGERVVLRGWVDPSWLDRAARPTTTAYRDDLDGFGARSKIGRGAWIGATEVPEGWTYLGSDYQEKVPMASRAYAGRKPLVDRDNVPNDLQIELELLDDSVQISLRQGERMNAKVRTLPPWVGGGDFAVSTGDWTIHGSLYLDSAGDLRLGTGPTPEAARAQAEQSAERIGQGGAFLRSDWMNAKTGETLTVALARSDNWTPRLRAALPSPADVRAPDGVWQGYEFDGWRLVVRKQFDRHVLVAGSGQTFDELVRIGALVGRRASPSDHRAQ